MENKTHNTGHDAFLFAFFMTTTVNYSHKIHKDFFVVIQFFADGSDESICRVA